MQVESLSWQLTGYKKLISRILFHAVPGLGGGSLSINPTIATVEVSDDALIKLFDHIKTCASHLTQPICVKCQLRISKLKWRYHLLWRLDLYLCSPVFWEQVKRPYFGPF